MKPSPLRLLLQVGTFFRKELLDVLRQPRLLLTLVLGPFAVMAIFGLGYRDTPKPMRTLFVVPKGSPLEEEVNRYTDELGAYVDLRGVVPDQAVAERRLQDGDVDLVVAFPNDPLADVLAGKRSIITVVHTRLDPVEQATISFASQLAVDQLNGEVLATIVRGGQEASRPATELIRAADTALAALDSAIGSGDEAATAAALSDVQSSTSALTRSVQILTLVADRLGGGQEDVLQGRGDQIGAAASDLRDAVDGLDASSTTAQVARAREAVDRFGVEVKQLTTVEADVLVQPLESRVRLAVAGVGGVTDWYAPAAVVLVLQQFGVAFGALSFVRERQLGVVEVLQIAPVGPAVTVIGKYLAYLVLGAGIGALLTGLLVAALDVPLAAGWEGVALVMGLTLFASIGVGLAVSLASATDAQAVQYTMLLLLASLFFSGFFLALDQMGNLGLAVSWLLPVTYGMAMLRDVMLRGTAPAQALLWGLAAYGAVAFVVVLLGTRRRMTGE